jgi:hypothetical protein
VSDGVLDTLILPHVNSDFMQLFLDEVATRRPKDRIAMILDGAGWHRSSTLKKPAVDFIADLRTGTQSCRAFMGRTSSRKNVRQCALRQHRSS